MGVVRIELGHPGYKAVNAAMVARGYATTVLSLIDGEDREMRLPPGHYRRDEPTDEERMRDDAYEVVTALGELGAQIIATSGLSAWRGLTPADWPS